MHSGTAGVVHHATVVRQFYNMFTISLSKYPAAQLPAWLLFLFFVIMRDRNMVIGLLPSYADHLPILQNKHASQSGTSVRS